MQLLLTLLLASAQYRYATHPYNHKGVSIQADEVFHKKDKVWFRLRIINQTGKFLTIDKGQVQLRVSGSLLPREKGVFGKYAKPKTINPGLSDEFNIEFVIGEVPQPIAMVLEQGFVVEGKSLSLPDYPAEPAGAR